jgi:hypothetical protein
VLVRSEEDFHNLLNMTTILPVKSSAALLLFLAPFTVTHLTPKPAPSAIQVLVCRGKPGTAITVNQNPSPFSPQYVRMAMSYTKPTGSIGANYENLSPGMCSWNPHGFPGIPPEPGVVYIDMAPQAQRWAGPETRQIDTTVNAAVFFADTISFPRYMQSADHYWLFYVDDQTNSSFSFGAMRQTVKEPTYVTITGPVVLPASTPAPAQSPPTSSSVGKPRSPTTSKTAAAATLAKLIFRGVDRRPNGFTARFTARPNASATVAYSTSSPVNTPSGWYFGGAAVQGSGAVSRGGFDAPVTVGKSGGVFAEYAGSSRLPLERGVTYNFIITVEGGGPREQYVGHFVSMQQDIGVNITDLKVTKQSFKQEVRRGVQVFRNVGGRYTFCDTEGCDNASDVIGILVWARPEFGGGDDPPTSWTAQPGKNSGVAKLTFDTRLIKPERPMRSFTVTSASGDVEFEAIGEIRVRWH